MSDTHTYTHTHTALARSVFGKIVFGSLVNSCQLQMHRNLMNYPSIQHELSQAEHAAQPQAALATGSMWHLLPMPLPLLFGEQLFKMKIHLALHKIAFRFYLPKPPMSPRPPLVLLPP